jgi:hypothetical protein
MSTLSITLPPFTLAEFAMLVRIVDEAMWEIVSNPRRDVDAALQDRVCGLIGLPGYDDQEAPPAIVAAARGTWPHEATDRVHQLIGDLAASALQLSRFRESEQRLLGALEDCWKFLENDLPPKLCASAARERANAFFAIACVKGAAA